MVAWSTPSGLVLGTDLGALGGLEQSVWHNLVSALHRAKAFLDQGLSGPGPCLARAFSACIG